MKTSRRRCRLQCFTLLVWFLVRSSALLPCSPTNIFYVNRITGTCSAPVAIPWNITGTYLGVDLGVAVKGGESLSLVQESPSCIPQLQTCQSSASNLQYASISSSGWMRPVSPGYKAVNISSPTELSINQSDTDRAISMIKVGCYSICWKNASGLWRNLGMIVNVQGDFLGLQFNGITNANGLRAGIPRWYTPAIAAVPSRVSVSLPMRSVNCR